MKRWICNVGISALLLAGCGIADLERPGSPPLTTDRGRYEAAIRPELDDAGEPTDTVRVELVIPFAYVNETGSTVYVDGCSRPALPVLEKNVEGRWVAAFRSADELCREPQSPILPGERWLDTLRVQDELRFFDPAIQDEADLPGTYRLVARLYADEGLTMLLSLKESVSNLFEIVVGEE